MMTIEDCMRAAFQALLRGDLAERDRMCDLARNIINARDRIQKTGDASDIIQGTPIQLPTQTEERQSGTLAKPNHDLRQVRPRDGNH